MSWRSDLPHVGAKWTKQSSPLERPIRPRRFLEWDSRTYSIGSCFAMELNRWLRHHGFSVPAVSWGMHYNPRTILYELRRAVGQAVPHVDWVVDVEGGTRAYIDATRHCVDATTPGELALVKEEVSAKSRDMFAAADSFLITLGLADIWEAQVGAARVVVNRAPYRDAVAFDGLPPGAFSNRFLSPDECLQDLRDIVSLIQLHKGPTIPIVITVSPVPLKHTAKRGLHPQVANSRSKAVLLAAVFALLEEQDETSGVSYFPIYEFFQTNPLGMDLWQGDARHPSAEAVGAVAHAFVHAYSRVEIEPKPGFSVPRFHGEAKGT
ncbi:MAG: GSCFA domain-containing protein [Myxococcales bacterium]|nr:GSCFA domain-containing protein [Myxococcales bacterium]